MTVHSSDVDLVYLDLCDAVESLDGARASPKNVRRALSRYVELSQRLTAVMRRDFSERKGKKWEATSFDEWTPKTEFLKYLRNQDQHSMQVFVTVHERHYYDVPDDVEILGIPGRQFVIDNLWQLTDQTADQPPKGIEVRLPDPGLPPAEGPLLPATRVDSWYEFFPRNAEQQLRAERAGVGDLHSFVVETFATLTAYYKSYKRKLDA